MISCVGVLLTYSRVFFPSSADPSEQDDVETDVDASDADSESFKDSRQ